MRSRLKRSFRGYSLVELLVVIAIIGILSLISVPAFMNFRRAGEFKAAMGTFTTDLRNARAASISNSFDVRVELPTTGSKDQNYFFYWSRDNGKTWTPLTLPGSVMNPAANPGDPPNMKRFSGTVWVDTTTGLPDYSLVNPAPPAAPTANNMPDVVYHPSGAMTLAAGSSTATIVLATNWTKIAFDRYTINLSPSGQFRAVGSHT
ncbi:MAG: hypothetical protein NVSMB68_09680 [Thermoanaerobaculia bacterium]